MLTKNVSALELDTKASIEGGLKGVDLQGGKLQGVRIEFENGKPVALSVISTVTCSGSAAFLEKVTGTKFSGEITGTITQRFPLNGKFGGDIDAITQNPGAAIEGTTPTISVSLSATGKAGDVGVEASLKIENMDNTKLGTFMERMLSGDPEGALAATSATVTVSFNTYTDEARGWSNNELGIGPVTITGENFIHHVANTQEKTFKASADGKHLEAA